MCLWQGLGWAGPIRFRTASSLVLLMERVQETLPLVSYPFLVFQDPADTITTMAGVETLLRVSLTSTSDKTLVVMPGGRHDVFTNRLVTVTEQAAAWMAGIVSRATAANTF